MRKLLVPTLVVLFASANAVNAEDWLQWRGAGRAGVRLPGAGGGSSGLIERGADIKHAASAERVHARTHSLTPTHSDRHAHTQAPAASQPAPTDRSPSRGSGSAGLKFATAG